MQNLKNKKVIASLIQKNDTIFIAQRGKQDALYGKWEFPGGKMEHNETEQECLRRELLEEFGIEATIGSYFCSSFFEHKGSTVEMRMYYVSSFSGEIQLNEHLDMKWVPISDLPSYDMPDPDKPVVQKLLELL